LLFSLFMCDLSMCSESVLLWYDFVRIYVKYSCHHLRNVLLLRSPSLEIILHLNIFCVSLISNFIANIAIVSTKEHMHFRLLSMCKSCNILKLYFEHAQLLFWIFSASWHTFAILWKPPAVLARFPCDVITRYCKIYENCCNFLWQSHNNNFLSTICIITSYRCLTQESIMYVKPYIQRNTFLLVCVKQVFNPK